jgi:hypothetical protein
MPPDEHVDSGRDPRDVRPMPGHVRVLLDVHHRVLADSVFLGARGRNRIEGIGAPHDEVANHFRAACRLEEGMFGKDAAVDDRDRDAASVVGSYLQTSPFPLVLPRFELDLEPFDDVAAPRGDVGGIGKERDRCVCRFHPNDSRLAPELGNGSQRSGGHNDSHPIERVDQVHAGRTNGRPSGSSVDPVDEHESLLAGAGDCQCSGEGGIDRCRGLCGPGRR